MPSLLFIITNQDIGFVMLAVVFLVGGLMAAFGREPSIPKDIPGATIEDDHASN